MTLAGCLAAVLALSACGGSAEPSADPTDPSPAAAASESPSPPEELGTIKESGFGQRGQYVWATAVVHNNSAHVGQTVTVQFNVLDDSGELLASESQVEAFHQPEADHALGTQVALEPGQKAATIEATLDVEPYGAFTDKPFPDMPIDKMTLGKEYGSPKATFELTNPLTVALKSPRLVVVCRDNADEIIGGGAAFPTLVPASGTIKVDPHLLVSGDPANCEVHAGPPIDWDGEGLPDNAPAPSAEAGSAESALKTWVDQFNAKDWSAQYATLVRAQQAVISKDQYALCRSKEVAPVFTWKKVLAVTDAGEMPIPGADTTLPGTKVTVQLVMDGVKVPLDAHMFREDGEWHWTMTQENLDNCL